MLISRVIFILFISMLFSAKQYNVVVNNDLDLIEDFTFQDFYDIQDAGAGAGTYGKLFSGGIYSDNFPFIKYLEVIKFQRRSVGTVFYSDLDGTNEIKVTADNFQEFRQNFLTRKCLKFDETEFPSKVFKVKSQSNTSEITFLDRPDSKGGILEGDPNEVVYYVFGKKEITNNNGEEEIYYLLGSKEKANFKSLGDRVLGWVLAYKEEEVQQVILWNTNLGVRPKADLETDLKPIVFTKSSSGGISHGEYVDNLTLNEEDIMMGEEGLEQFQDKYEDRGIVRRWLPNYLFEDNEYGIKVGLMLDYNNVRQDIMQTASASEYNIIIVVDASLSMDFTWNSLRPVLDMTIKNLEKQTVMNSIGEPMTPRFKVWAYHLNTQQVTSDWVDSESNFDYASEIKNACCTGSNGIRPVLYETLKAAIQDASTETAYAIVIGDASDRAYPGQYLSGIEDLQNSFDPNYPKSLKGIRIYSSTVQEAYDYPQNFSSISTANDFVAAYQEFESHFGQDDLLYEVSGGTKTIMSTDEQITLADNITSVLKDDLDITYSLVTNIISGKGMGTADEKTSKLSGLSQIYIQKLREAAKDFKTGSGTFYDEGIIVSNTPDGEVLLDTDVLVPEEDLEELNDYIAEYSMTEDTDDAEALIKQMLAIFFDVDRGDVDDKFLSETTILDFWRKVVGNQEIADKLVPELFSQSDYTFEELIEELPSYEELFLANCQNISNNLIEQMDTKFSLLVTSVTVGQSADKFYWVHSDNLQLFKGISLD